MAENNIRLIDRTMLTRNPEGAGVAEIGADVGLPPATVYRILTTLCAHGAVSRVSKGLYQIGPAVLSWANAYSKKTGISRIAELHVERLWEETGETVNLFYLEGWQLSFIKRLQSPQPISTNCKVGGKLDLYSSSAGRAVLSALPDRVICQYLDTVELVPRTARTLIGRQELWDKIMEARALGYGEENEENEPGIRCVGAAILDPGANPVGAVSLTVPAFRLTDERVGVMGGKVLVTARIISEGMGRKDGAAD